MANSYKDIVITPNRGSSTDDPKIVFSGANTSVNTDITLRAYPEANGTLSFEGSAGQLFSITNDLTGSIFSVNDVSGIPLIDVNVTSQLVTLVPFYGNVSIGSGIITTSGGTSISQKTAKDVPIQEYNTQAQYNTYKAFIRSSNANNTFTLGRLADATMGFYGYFNSTTANQTDFYAVLDNNGIWTASSEVRGTLFRDLNNTAYYVDGAGTSVVNQVNYTLLNGPTSSSRDKIRLYGDGTAAYNLGMASGFTFGAVNSDWAMTFQMSNDSTRGFWWGDTAHTAAQGAMSLSTDGKLAIAHSIRAGYGESDTTVPGATYRLDVSGSALVTTDIRSPIFYDSNDTSVRWDAGTFVLRSASPTIYFRDSDGSSNSAMIHVNANTFYVLRGTGDTETWSTVGGVWPLTINLNTNAMAVGGALSAPSLSLTTALPVASGGTGVTTSTGSGSVVLSTSPTLVTPALGTPASGNLANCTFPTLNQNTTGSAGSVTNALTINNGGAGSASGTTYNGSAAVTISHNSIGAVPTSRTIGIVQGTGVTVTTSGSLDLTANRSWTIAIGQDVATTAAPTFAGETLTGLSIGRTASAANVSVANDGGSYSARGSTTQPAVMSFHRAGAYAINMGLDTDNIFKIGGWSDGVNAYRLQLAAPGGTHTFNGTVAATTFSGAGTSLTGTAASLTAGNATKAGNFTPSQTNGVASRIVVADGSGYINNNYFNSTDDVSAGTLTYLMGKFGDNYYRSATAAKVATFISGQSITANNLTVTGTGGRTLLATVTGTNVASLAYTSLSGYRNYEIIFENLLPVTQSTTLLMQMYGGGAYLTGTYRNAAGGIYTNNAFVGNSTATSSIQMTYGGYFITTATGGSGVSGAIRLYNTTSTTTNKNYDFQVTGPTYTTNFAALYFGGGWYAGSQVAVTGFQLYAASGNITGTVYIYGYN